jgi:Carboxypeptidase regulatory-like domain
MLRKQNIALLSVLYAVAAYAQVTTSSISGFVLDPSGKPIQKAKVTVSDPSHAISRSVYTDAAGFYHILDLAPALYQVSGEASQFAKTEGPSVELEVNEQARVDFHLPVEGQNTQVTIRATESLVPTESSDLGTVIDRSRVEGLPLNQRDFLQLALLTPGVAPPVEGSQLSTRGGFAMHANGGREEFNNFLLDGVDNNDQDVNRYVLQPSVDSIQEFKISTNAYSAEYGRNAGAQVNVITRSGTNQGVGDV